MRTDDEFIARFVIAGKYNLEDSFKLYCNYYCYRQRNQDIFNKLNSQDVLIQQALRDGFPGILDKRDRKGRCILLLIASRWNHSCYSLLTIYRSLLLTLEHLISEEVNQYSGFVLIIDWTEFSFKQSSSLNPRILKLIIEGLQDCFPAKFKGIHFIGQPWYVEAALTVIKPFLKDKSKQKIYLHGNNLSTLHDYVSKDVLPAELGGEGPPYNPIFWAEKLINAAIDDQCDQQSDFKS
ncbi:UNVERIFIED_CONTAM: hypothetical protein PYX00_002718 [Menopon gallinae]|uniref:CRAL-TRIO domain-containing protein n=1 Tax=Menopon gallinae TaxID=328185 RepID=A0AAW2HXE2_9NEOP